VAVTALLPGVALEPVSYREHVASDVANWPEATAAAWQDMVKSANGRAWIGYGPAEVELRAWLQLRGSLAREPIVLNRHHLTPSAPQPTGSAMWPPKSIYCGRAPMSSREDDQGWRYARMLGNPYSRDLYHDALERYRIDLRRWLHEDNAAAARLALDPKCGARRSARIDAIRDMAADSVLVCSCVSSPWTPTLVVKPGQPLPSNIVCHCHLIVAAWRSFRRSA